ncbi:MULTISPECIES: hypothetical protein [Sphingobacterium]|jgi:predicted nucleotide-binding protein (sugar kinase/HSP70/actin superfamily)|uniref:hypothetical protein n=1 Tax=Sphingobacterium TaxID=28453 RepID=UPI0004E5F14C|nr:MULTISPECIES: hypothetical protein [Sphingobacterium]CDT09035.1 hypothetical protein BN1088_1433533 [Sphingobacterium sp. PM2-P1-29]SJN44944.1 hypothetical protein FM120_16010 [Sphingobacterium faecium PCAi_F2.5]HCU45632.1 hypothetical protein [Sphingobacterium sp.]UPZ38602.1 hypothetical protein MUB18_09915 [Sphingobacterium sp. PCS056]UXD70055.1 hypothetical protein MUK51_01940 [Sphingobacterium faecium]
MNMQFLPVNYHLLRQLQIRGYNILASAQGIDHENPSYYPIQVTDVWDYLVRIDSTSKVGEPALIVIDDALRNVEEQHFDGAVFVDFEMD